jgi:peptidoglycan/xylan/chitin deacetylase (PgdA/CDA1 family)
VSAIALTYHKIGPQKEFGITTVATRRFAGHLDFLLGLGVEFVRAGDAATGAHPARTVALTFDDGYECVYQEAVPEMRARGIPGTVFQVVGSVGGFNRWDVRLTPGRVRHLSWAQLRELAEAGFEIGSHTITHRDLTGLDPSALERELRGSREMIEDAIGRPATSISYPFGRCSRRVMEAAAAAGYACGFVSYPRRRENPMALGRWAVYSFDGPQALERKMGLRPGRCLEKLKNLVVARLSLGTTLVKRRDEGDR